MGALEFILSEHVYLTLFNINEILASTSDFFFSHTLSSNMIVRSFLSIVLVRNIAFVFTIKLTLSIMLLILVRGGTPRYRYDYLTKLGWLKFFGLTVIFFLTLLFVYFLF